MKKPQQYQDTEETTRDMRPQEPAREDSSGEGAASALESLRKLEQSRRAGQPAGDRPATE